MYEHSQGRSKQMPMKNVGNSSVGRSQEVPKISGHPCIGRMGALRGHLCDSTAFLLYLRGRGASSAVELATSLSKHQWKIPDRISLGCFSLLSILAK